MGKCRRKKALSHKIFHITFTVATTANERHAIFGELCYFLLRNNKIMFNYVGKKCLTQIFRFLLYLFFPFFQYHGKLLFNYYN